MLDFLKLKTINSQPFCAFHCNSWLNDVQPEPEFRPPMSEVVQALVRLVQRANMSIKMGREDSVGTSRRAADDLNDYLQ